MSPLDPKKHAPEEEKPLLTRVSEHVENLQLSDLLTLLTRFRTLALLTLLNLSCSGESTPAPSNDETAPEPISLVSVDDPRTAEELHLDLVKDHDVLRNSRQPLLWGVDSYAKELSKNQKRLAEAKENLKKQEKKKRPKNDADAKKYDEKIERLQGDIATYEARIARLKASIEGVEKLHQDTAWIAFLEKTNYKQLVEIGAVLPIDLLEDAGYLNVEGLWKRKVAIAKGSQKPICEEIQRNLPARQREKLSYEGLYERIDKSVEALRPNAKTLGFTSPYLEYIDADTLISISIHEMMPSQYDALAKIHTLRVLLDEGFEPEYVPAIFDPMASYGLYQTIAKTHKGMESAYQQKVLSVSGLPEGLQSIQPFQESDSVEEQTLVVYLLSLENHQNLYNFILRKDPNFRTYFDRSTEAERRVFFSGLAGYLHNHGFNSASLLKIFNNPENPILNPNTPDATLKDAYDRFVTNSGGGSNKASIASRHAKGTGDLVSYVVSYGMVDHPFYVREEAKTGEVVASAEPSETTSPEVKPALGITRTTLLPKQVKGQPNFVFTVPNWQLDRMMKALLANPSLLEEVRANNGGGHISPGKVIYLPTKLMKAELQSGQLLRIEVKDAKDAEAILSRILKPAYKNQNNFDTIFVLSNAQNWRTWDDIDTAIRVPEAWVNVEKLTNLPQAEPQEKTPPTTVEAPEAPSAVQTRTNVEGPFVVDLVPHKPRVALFALSYQPLIDRAKADGMDLSDPNKRALIYDNAVRNSVRVPAVGEGYHLKDDAIDARMMETAYEVLQKFAAEFKKRSGGYSIVVTDLLRSLAQQDAISISKGTHPTGYSWDNADGRFYDPSGTEITWSVKVNGQWQRGPNADLIDKTLRPLLILMLEEYQAQGLMMVYNESEPGAKLRHPGETNPKSGGHYHVSVTASNRGPVGPLMQ